MTGQSPQELDADGKAGLSLTGYSGLLLNMSVPAATAGLPAVRSAYKAPSREGKIHIGACLHPDFKRSLRLVQRQNGEDVQTLVVRALNDLFNIMCP